MKGCTVACRPRQSLLLYWSNVIEDGRGPRKDLGYQAKELGLYPLSRVKAYVEHCFRTNLVVSGFKTRH